jgi:hypothetical protein
MKKISKVENLEEKKTNPEENLDQYMDEDW